LLFRRFAFVLVLNLVLGVLAGGSALADDDTSKGRGYAIASLANVAGADYSDATDINDRGQVVGLSGTRAVMQLGGRLTDLGVPAGRTSSWAFGQNERSQIVGGTQDQTGYAHAASWENGRWTELANLPGGKISEAHAINSRGQMVGYSTLTGDLVRHAVLWDNKGKAIDLGTLPGDTNSEARGINDRGEIVGESYTTEGQRHAVVWRDRVISALPTLPGGGDSAAYGINNRGQVAGFSGIHAALWENRGVKDLGTLPGSRSSRAYDINDRGDVVGSSDVAFYPHAVLFKNGAVIDLGSLPGGTQSEARSINDQGRIVGQSYDSTGHGHAVSWDRAR
jgi:probable HAF family extracellular repeat protein